MYVMFLLFAYGLVLLSVWLGLSLVEYSLVTPQEENALDQQSQVPLAAIMFFTSNFWILAVTLLLRALVAFPAG